MFSHLSERLSNVIKNLTGQGRLTDSHLRQILPEIRTILLEADVALPVVDHFINEVEKEAVGEKIMESLTPGQALIQLVYNKLVSLMGEKNEGLSLNTQPPAVILMAGLQGSGKTTTVAKLAKWLQDSQKKTVLVASTDIYRPAAIDQLETLAKNINAGFFPSQPTEQPINIAKNAIQAAKNKSIDVVIIDTAGRLHIDEPMMQEIKALHAAAQPIETLFVVDSMTGQDAANTAKAFHDALPLTGVILTKADGDARGGAALSIRHITGTPIKFIGVGEKVDALELFHPDRIASSILDRGDVLTLIEKAAEKVNQKEAEKLAKKIKKGGSFNLQDFLNQLKQVHEMGGVAGIMSKLPGMNQIPQQVKDQFNDKKLIKIEAMINSMTPKERRFPNLIKNSQKRRIAGGSGTDLQGVNQLLKQFEQMKKMMQKVSKKGGMMKLMRNIKGKFPFGGGLPPSMPF
jgi:signal recognition particle subunit SRP54